MVAAIGRPTGSMRFCSTATVPARAMASSPDSDVVASIPYLWPAAPEPFERTLLAFLAWQYLTGSLLFFLGGLFNYWRAYVVVRSEIAARQSAA